MTAPRRLIVLYGHTRHRSLADCKFTRTNTAVRTLCHDCSGNGSIGVRRTVDLPDYEFAAGYQLRDCRGCGSRHRLPGLLPRV